VGATHSAPAAKNGATAKGKSSSPASTSGSKANTSAPNPASAQDGAQAGAPAQPNAAAGANKDIANAVTAAANSLNSGATTPSGSAPAKPVSPADTAAPDAGKQGDGGDQGGDGGAVPASATQTPQQPQTTQPPVAAQPVAAAIVLNAAADTTASAPTTPASASGPIIDGGAKGRAKTLSLIDDGTLPTQGAKDADPVKPALPESKAAGTNPTEAKSDNSSSVQTTNGAAPQQSQPGNDAVVPAQADGAAGADAVHAPRTDGLAATSPSDTVRSPGAAAAGAAKAGIDGLPNFGLTAGGTTTAAAVTAATPDAPTAASVPLNGLAVAIAARATAGSNQFDIRLDPPELGRIDVRLEVDRNGQVTSHITVDRADTLDLLQRQQPQLQHALEQAGLKTADNGLQFTLRDQTSNGQNNSGGSQQSAAQLVIPDADLAPVAATQTYTRYGLGGGIDIRV
jgi:flagellar hook-length control protein FliK